ncbi:MAG: matrixin family metalloprotease [Nitrososphaera sp.]|nr:matrixin family metalloprotease [Nitrososphaera sp.]
MNFYIRSILLPSLAASLFFCSFNVVPALAATYYSEQTNFAESFAPPAGYSWSQGDIDACIYKDEDVSNSYYAWTKLAVQKWRQALREYTDSDQEWTVSAKYVTSKSLIESCDVKIYIFSTYKKFPDYPSQTGAYTSVRQEGGRMDSRVYLSPFVLHGDGKTELNLPSYAFRNSAIHEFGHVLGLGHMKSEKGYLMSPQFDFHDQDAEYPITTLELRALVRIYGDDGFGE